MMVSHYSANFQAPAAAAGLFPYGSCPYQLLIKISYAHQTLWLLTGGYSGHLQNGPELYLTSLSGPRGVVMERIELSLSAYQTLFLPLKDITISEEYPHS
jgi:hypothetical protein